MSDTSGAALSMPRGGAVSGGAADISFNCASPDFTSPGGNATPADDSLSWSSGSGALTASGSDYSSYGYTEDYDLQLPAAGGDTLNWLAASGAGSVNGGTTESWSYAGSGSYAQPLPGGSGMVQGSYAASGGQTFSLDYEASATLAPGQTAWSYTNDGGSLSASSWNDSSYSGSGSDSCVYATSYGGNTYTPPGSDSTPITVPITWNVSTSYASVAESGGENDQSGYEVPLTMVSGNWQAGGGTYSSSNETMSDYSYEGGGAFADGLPSDEIPTPSQATTWWKLAVTSDADVVTRSRTTNYNTANPSTATTTNFGDGANGGMASETSYLFGSLLCQTSDSWAPISPTEFEQSGSRVGYCALRSQRRRPRSARLCVGRLHAPAGGAADGTGRRPDGGGEHAPLALGKRLGAGERCPVAARVSAPMLGNGGAGLFGAPGGEPASVVLGLWPAILPDVWAMTCTPAIAPRTPLADGNAPARALSLPRRSRGADAALGANNVANVYPVTRSPQLADYALNGVSAGGGSPANTDADSYLGLLGLDAGWDNGEGDDADDDSGDDADGLAAGPMAAAAAETPASGAETFNSQGQLATLTNADGGATSFSYATSGSLASLTDPDGNTTSWTYNSQNQVTQETNSLGNSDSLAYNSAGQLVGYTDADGNVRTYQYDSAGHVATETLYASAADEAAGNAEDTLNFAYDSAGNLVSESDDSASDTYAYDSQNRLTSATEAEADTPTVVITYTYSGTSTEPSGVSVTIGGVADYEDSYSYNSAGQLTQIVRTAADPSGGDAVAETVDMAYNCLRPTADDRPLPGRPTGRGGRLQL